MDIHGDDDTTASTAIRPFFFIHVLDHHTPSRE
jgi:hypothetical protein